MELWEYNACVNGFNKRDKARATEQLTIAWHIAAFSGAAFAGKLKPLKTYLKNDEIKASPQIDKEEFEAKLRLLQKG